MSIVGLLVIALIVWGAWSLLVPAPDIAAATSTTPAGRALVERFVTRSRRFRTIGGSIGIVVSVVVANFAAEAGSPPSMSVGLLPALAGAVLGSILAESFRVRQAEGPRSASLGVRQEGDYGDSVADSRERIVALVAAAMTVLAVATGTWISVVFAGVIAVIAVVRRWTEQRVVLRGRPALDADLRSADDEVRRMAVRHGLSRPAVTLMVLLAAGQAAALQSAFAEESTMRNALGIASLGLSITGVVWWWTNRNFGFPSVRNRGARALAIGGLVVLGVMVLFLVAGRSGP